MFQICSKKPAQGILNVYLFKSRIKQNSCASLVCLLPFSSISLLWIPTLVNLYYLTVHFIYESINCIQLFKKSRTDEKLNLLKKHNKIDHTFHSEPFLTNITSKVFQICMTFPVLFPSAFRLWVLLFRTYPTYQRKFSVRITPIIILTISAQ